MSLNAFLKFDNLAKHKFNDLLKQKTALSKNVTSELKKHQLIYVGKPVHGSDFYWKCRSYISIIKKKAKRCARYLDLNHDFGRASLVGVPKTSFDPKNNIIFVQMDNEEWAGLGSKMMLNISMNILFFLHISFWMYFIYFRLLVNNKLNVFKKWKDQS